MGNDLSEWPNSDHWQSLYDDVQHMIVEGEHSQGRDQLKKQNPQKVPREWASRFADLAVRLHLPVFALKTLHPFVFQDGTFEQHPTVVERMTYARALYHLGAVEESLEILNSLNAQEEPEVYFLRACASIFNWNYSEAVSDLKDYLRANKMSAYRRVVVKVNLLASYVSLNEWTEAHKILQEVQAECSAKSYKLLLGNSFELQSQIEIFQGRFDKALNTLTIAQDLLKTQGALYSLYVEKWKAVCLSLQMPTSENLEKLDEVRSRALEVGHWSTLRECDLFQAIATKNEDLIRKVIMGTPSEYYRQRARKLFKTDIVFRGEYEWKLKGDQPATEEVVFNPYHKKQDRPALYEKPMLLSLFEALASDFYQPSHISLLFKKIYPQEKFNPFTSPARVLQLLRRLDVWFQENNLPLRVRFKKSEFCLRTMSDVTVIVQRGKDLAQQSSKDRQIADLRSILKNKSLSVQKICEQLKISESSARRLLRQGLMDGQIKKLGTGRATVYLAGRARQKSEAM